MHSIEYDLPSVRSFFHQGGEDDLAKGRKCHSDGDEGFKPKSLVDIEQFECLLDSCLLNRSA
jgi:hypothetical protein